MRLKKQSRELRIKFALVHGLTPLDSIPLPQSSGPSVPWSAPPEMRGADVDGDGFDTAPASHIRYGAQAFAQNFAHARLYTRYRKGFLSRKSSSLSASAKDMGSVLEKIRDRVQSTKSWDIHKAQELAYNNKIPMHLMNS
jgi:hypothetical protein